MKIRVLKQSLQEALVPLSKVHASTEQLIVLSQDKNVSLAVADSSVQLVLDMPLAVTDGDGCCSVFFKQFKTVLDGTHAQSIELELGQKTLAVRGDTERLADLPCTQDKWCRKTVPEQTDCTALPTGFAMFLIQIIQTASTDNSRIVLRGAHVSDKGIAGTDGRQLSHIPLPLSLKGDVILPSSPIYSALRKYRWKTLACWDDSFAITGVGFELVMKKQQGVYPKYDAIFPAPESLDVSAELNASDVPQVVEFLKAIPKQDNAPTELWVYADRIELVDQSKRRVAAEASCSMRKPPASVCCNARFLLQMLTFGHTKLSFAGDCMGPIVATGGSGRYLFMPLQGKPRPSSESSSAYSMAESQPPIKPVEKEKTTMQTVSTIAPIHATARPDSQSSPSGVAALGQVEPLAELSASIAAMREHLETLNARLTEAARKVREAAVQQRQKERAYQETSRKLDRIRMAV